MADMDTAPVEDGLVRKQEADFTKDVDDALPKATALMSVRRAGRLGATLTPSLGSPNYC